jgi:hypothetical protein
VARVDDWVVIRCSPHDILPLYTTAYSHRNQEKLRKYLVVKEGCRSLHDWVVVYRERGACDKKPILRLQIRQPTPSRDVFQGL